MIGSTLPSKVTLPGDPPVEVHLRRSSSARRATLRVSALDGRVTLSVPKAMAVAEAIAFAQEKNRWVRGHLSDRAAPVEVQVGADIPFQGALLRIEVGDVRRARVLADRLLVPNSPAMTAPRVQAFLKAEARVALAKASGVYAGRLGLQHGRITLRDTRSRWGSCSARGDLMYSWRLIMAAPEVLTYVAAHEVAHLVEMNHSTAFWDVVRQLYPAFEGPRRWLRTNGADLHRYQFAN